MNVMGIIFANDGSMGTLTEKRTMASLPFGGRYRQVDFALSNLTCAGVRHIGIISRHSYQSLMHHIGSGEEWGLELGEGGLEFLTPFAQSTQDVYRGKLDSLNTAMDFLTFGDDEYVVMIDSAIVSNIDLGAVVAAHVASGKDVTVVTKAGIANGVKQLDLALKVGNQTLDTVTVGLGARVQAIVGENMYNRTSIFEARVLAKFDIGDRRSTTDVQLAGAKVDIESAERGAIGLEAGAGLTIPLGDEGSSIFMDASAEIRADYTDVNGTVGYRINF